MHFTQRFIQRPVFTIVLSLILLLVGLRAYHNLPVRQYPAIESNVINVTTNYSGASAKLMEGFITTPMESALASVDGIDFIDSSSAQGVSDISLHFRLGYDIDKAIADVSNQVASVVSELPKEADSPTITKRDRSSNATLYIAFTSHTVPEQDISDYLVRIVQPQIATLSGVGQAQIYSEREYAMRIWLDPERMAAHGVTADDVQQALQNNNVQTAAGHLTSKWQEFDVIAATDLNSAEQFNNLVVKTDRGYLIRIKDVGHAVLGVRSDRSNASVNGKPAVVMGVVPQATANPLEISKQVAKIFPRIQQQLPPGMNAVIVWDSSKFIAQSIKEVKSTILEATLCVVLVIFLFLGSLRAVIIPVIIIPLSLIGVCGVMLALGYTLNTLTLLAWVLAIGLVVDDAIVVLENIHRHIEAGMKPVAAALQGAREIGFAVVAMTLTLAAVYAPIGFMKGITGSLFREFAFTLAGAVLISGFVALTLSPMMCSRILHHNAERRGLPERIDELFNQLMRRYRGLLAKALAKRMMVAVLAAIVYASCFWLYTSLPSELAPSEDQGAIRTILSGPTSANIAYTSQYSNLLNGIYQSIPETAGYFIFTGYPEGVSSAISFLVLKPWSERQRSVDEIIKEMKPKLNAITGVQASPANPPPLPGSSGRHGDMQFVIKTTDSYETLDKQMKKFVTLVKKNPKITSADSDLKLDKLQVTLNVDRNKASDMGISTRAIGNTLNMLLGEPTVTRFIIQGRSYAVIPQMLADFRRNPQELDKINLRTASGDLVPLSNLATITEGVAPQELSHFGQLRSAILSVNLAPGYSMGEALSFLQEKAATELPETMTYDYKGQSRQFIEASGAMQQTFMFAILFIFLVLAAQFESFRAPFIIMISVPLSLAGALLMMKLTGCSINIYTQIGLVTLIGLITKHGILIVEFANQQQDEGKSVMHAVIDAAAMRLRPILMTTAAMILGALPLALASGAGSEARRQLGWVIIGGMSFGTLLTLFIVPTAYTLLARNIKKV